MSIIDKIFGGSDKGTNSGPTGWKTLTDLQQLEEIEDISATRPVIIFKHSTRCSVSRMALRSFEREYEVNPDADLYYLDLLSYRNISNAVADRFKVHHQSPQILIINQGRSTFDASHGDINAEWAKKAIRDLD